MSKQILFGKEVQEKLKVGIDVAVTAVGSTFGPRGTNVGIDRGFETWIIHDGVNVFRNIELKDKASDFAVRVLREAANKQVVNVGDGTTQVTLLAGAIYTEALKVIAAGVNPMQLRRPLEAIKGSLVNFIEKKAIPVKTLQETINVATVSSEEKELGEMIGKLVHRVGESGVITVEESKGNETYIEHQEGMQFDKGYASPYFVTDPNRMEATVENPYVFITDKPMHDVHKFQSLFEMISKHTQNIVFIAPEITGLVLQSFVLTKLQGGMNILAVNAPLSGQKQKDILQDIALLTGATLVSEDAGMKFEQIDMSYLGEAKRITATKDATLIVGGKGKKELIAERVASIRAEIERAEGTEFEQEKLRERIAKLTNGIAVVYVGGATDAEIKERKERALDAVAATQAAIASGIVPGGATIFLHASNLVEDNDSIENQIMARALKIPFKKLLENAGYESAKYESYIKDNKGFDVTDGLIKDFIKEGIIDPAQVPIDSIQNAVSIAIQLLTTNTLIIPEDEKEKK